MAKTYVSDEEKAKGWLEEHGFRITKDNRLDIYQESRTNYPLNMLSGHNLPCVYDNSYITELPGFLFCFNGLVDLSVRSLHIETIPESIYSLTSLKFLHMSSCELKEIPEGIGELISLERFSIYNNMVEELPDSICNLENLECLVISNNNFSELPESISSLSSLTTLNFNDNPIPEIPDWIINLTNLNTINCAFCDISTIPDYMTHLTSLNSLIFDSNSIPGVPCIPRIGNKSHEVSLEYKPAGYDKLRGELALYAPKINKMIEDIGIPRKIGNTELVLNINVRPDINTDLRSIISRSNSLLDIDEHITSCAIKLG